MALAWQKAYVLYLSTKVNNRSCIKLSVLSYLLDIHREYLLITLRMFCSILPLFVFSRCIIIWNGSSEVYFENKFLVTIYQLLQNPYHIKRYLKCESIHITCALSMHIIWQIVGQKILFKYETWFLKILTWLLKMIRVRKTDKWIRI